ncbi:MAG: hypothetical protein AB1921_15210 [Thermodesulfobacteriota bacterium]
MKDFAPRTLGRTGLAVGPLGVAAAYGAPARSFEAAFDRGCNYFYYGAMRRGGMKTAIKNLMGQGKRDKMVIAVQSFARTPFLVEASLRKALSSLSIEQADVLILGWHNKPPSPALMDKAAGLKEKGMVRFLAVSSHHRPLYPQLAADGRMDIFHLRYNAAHPGAEKDVFPLLPKENRPGIVVFTSTCWGHLLNPKKMPPGQAPPTAADCYRFVLTNPDVNACVCGPKTDAEMQGALLALDQGPMNDEELARMRAIGAHVHGRHGRFF